MPVRKKERAMSASQQKERRADLRAARKQAARRTANYNLVVDLCQQLLGVEGEELAALATLYSDRIDLIGWFAVEIDDGVREVASDKVALFEAAARHFIEPVLERHGDPEFYAYRTNYRAPATRTMRFYLGTWKGLCRHSFAHHLEAWLKNEIKGISPFECWYARLGWITPADWDHLNDEQRQFALGIRDLHDGTLLESYADHIRQLFLLAVEQMPDWLVRLTSRADFYREEATGR